MNYWTWIIPVLSRNYWTWVNPVLSRNYWTWIMPVLSRNYWTWIIPVLSLNYWTWIIPVLSMNYWTWINPVLSRNYYLLDLGKPHHSIRCMVQVHSKVWLGYRNRVHVIDPRLVPVHIYIIYCTVYIVQCMYNVAFIQSTLGEKSNKKSHYEVRLKKNCFLEGKTWKW